MNDKFEIVYKKPDVMKEKRMHHCPGCLHSTIHKLIAEVIDEMAIQNEIIGVTPVGCSVFAYKYIDIDFQQASHGRAAAVATGISRMLPDKYVFSYQGDGDLAAIGTAESIHACNRGENFTFIFVNNGIYGMTGGQMAPTTIEGVKTTTSPFGRDKNNSGLPLKMAELVSNLPGVVYSERISIHTPALIRKAKNSIKKTFEMQKTNPGTTFLEFLSNCPSGWKCTPLESIEWIKNTALEYYPSGVFKDVTKEEFSDVK